MTHRSAPRARGFTLIEILVVVGILVLLIAILLPVLSKVRKSAARTQTASELQSIATALDAFKLDHGDYPRVGAEVGFAVLGRELMGPYGNGTMPDGTNDPADPPTHASGTIYNVGDAVRNGTTVGAQTWVALRENTGGTLARNADWHDYAANDGLDGPGGRNALGKKGGPYLQQDVFKMRGLALLDRSGGPILYFPARPGNLNITIAGTGSAPPAPYVDHVPRPATGDISEPVSLWDAGDNFEQFRRNGDADAVVRARIRGMLGDLDDNGVIDEGETAAATSGFILWAAGADGFFGPTMESATPTQQEVDRCDDVVNFKQ